MAKKKLNFSLGNLTALLLLGVVIILAGVILSRVDSLNTPPPPEKNLKMFFVINASGGTFVQNEEDNEEENRYTLTLTSTSPTTYYFSSIPSRFAGAVELSNFLSTIWSENSDKSFASNPPNGALVIYNREKNEEDMVEIELLNPDYNEFTNTLTFDAILPPQNPDEERIKSFFDRNITRFPEDFENTTLFIDVQEADLQTNVLELLRMAATEDQE